MRIIKLGNTEEKEIPKTCGYCYTEFTYTKSDIQPDWRDGSYVICPVCKHFIAHDFPRTDFNRATDC